MAKKSFNSTKNTNNTDGENSLLFENSIEIIQLPAVMNVTEVSELLKVSIHTIYKWSSLNRFKRCCRKRGRHLRFNTEKLLQEFFGPNEWNRKDQR